MSDGRSVLTDKRYIAGVEKARNERTARQKRIIDAHDNLVAAVKRRDEPAAKAAKERARARIARYGPPYDPLETAMIRLAPKGSKPYRVNKYPPMKRRQYRRIARIARINGITVDEQIMRLRESILNAAKEAIERGREYASRAV